MTRDELNSIIGDEPTKRDTLAEVQAELDKLAPHWDALNHKRDELLAALDYMAQAKAEFFAAKEEPPVSEAEPIQTEPEPVAHEEVASEASENISTATEQETSDG